MEEYDDKKNLNYDCKTYIRIPYSVIMDTDMNYRRVAVFSYFFTKRGIDRSILFSLNDIAQWSGRKPDRNKDGANAKVFEIIKEFESDGYLSLLEEPKGAVCTRAEIDIDKVSNECISDNFAIVYIDEIKKIFEHYGGKYCIQDKAKNNDAVLLVFSYLRMVMVNVPETYDCTYEDMGKTLGLSEKMISSCVSILNDLGLIYYEHLPRFQLNGKYYSKNTLFCNRYKRKNSILVASEEEYYLPQVKKKKDEIKKYKRSTRNKK